MVALLALSGCEAAQNFYYPGMTRSYTPRYDQAAPNYAASGYAPPGQQLPANQQPNYQSPQPQMQPYVARTANDQAPHDYEHTKDVEIREKVPADDVWCRQPYVAETLKEVRNIRTQISLRRVLEMSGQTEPDNLTPYLISTIIGMTGSEHHCIGLSRDECIGDGNKHVCRGLVSQDRHPSVWTIFVIQGEHFDDARWRQDDVQY